MGTACLDERHTQKDIGDGEYTHLDRFAKRRCFVVRGGGEASLWRTCASVLAALLLALGGASCSRPLKDYVDHGEILLVGELIHDDFWRGQTDLQTPPDWYREPNTGNALADIKSGDTLRGTVETCVAGAVLSSPEGDFQVSHLGLLFRPAQGKPVPIYRHSDDFWAEMITFDEEDGTIRVYYQGRLFTKKPKCYVNELTLGDTRLRKIKLREELYDHLTARRPDEK